MFYQYFWHITMWFSSHYPNVISHNSHIVHMYYFINLYCFHRIDLCFSFKNAKMRLYIPIFTMRYRQLVLSESHCVQQTMWILKLRYQTVFLQWQISFLSKFKRIILIITPKCLQYVYFTGNFRHEVEYLYRNYADTSNFKTLTAAIRNKEISQDLEFPFQ